MHLLQIGNLYTLTHCLIN